MPQPAYAFLKGAGGAPIEWNFSKFLVGRDGKVRERFGQSCKPDFLDAQMPSWLA